MLSPFWQQHAPKIPRDSFRASPHFLDARGYDYDRAVRAVLDGPHARWLSRMVEDGAFGAETRPYALLDHGRVEVSRDLLDSILELGWLEEQLGHTALSRARILDVGAGYGRLAHRVSEVYPKARVFCADVVQVAGEICLDYLLFRKAPPRVLAWPIVGLPPQLDLAVNVHCWSECTREAIVQWIDLLRDAGVPRIFIVPHNGTLGAWSDELGGGCGPGYRDALEARGYRLVAHGLGPCGETQHRFLFALETT